MEIVGFVFDWCVLFSIYTCQLCLFHNVCSSGLIMWRGMCPLIYLVSLGTFLFSYLNMHEFSPCTTINSPGIYIYLHAIRFDGNIKESMYEGILCIL